MLTAPSSNLAWVEAPARLRLGPDQVHLWRACLDVDGDQHCRLALSLSDWERNRASRLRSDTHRRRYIAGRGIVRELLGLYTGTNPAEIEFELGPYGKPSMSNSAACGEVCFNYTDTGSTALYAMALECELGIDVENLDREIEYQRIATRKFSGRESSALLELAEPQGRHAFLACWTRKEAYGKAKGFGICYPLNSVDLCVDFRMSRMAIRDGAAGAGDRCWTLEQFYPDKEHVAAIVYAGLPRRLSYYKYQPEYCSAATR